MDTLFKVTAILAALAWLPKILSWIYNWLRELVEAAVISKMETTITRGY